VASPRTILFGSGPFALPTLERLADPGITDLVAVVTAPARPAGRGGEPRSTPVAQVAIQRGLPLLTPPTLKDEGIQAELDGLEPELIVLADYGRLIPGWLLALPRHGALNLHPSLLPRHRGASPIAAAILDGDARTGVTLILMDEGLDTGPILAQRPVALAGSETTPELEAFLANVAAEMLVEALPAWISGTMAAQPQPLGGATMTRPLRRADGRLDPDRPARRLERQVRAYQPWPGSWHEHDGERITVWRASVVDVTPEASRGDLVATAEGPVLVTTEGGLRLDEVQPAGRRRMSGAEYLRGRRHLGRRSPAADPSLTA
jgi:methionyl-tRNA formyltransferase